VDIPGTHSASYNNAALDRDSGQLQPQLQQQQQLKQQQQQQQQQLDLENSNLVVRKGLA
jgi:hypothetical protein